MNNSEEEKINVEVVIQDEEQQQEENISLSSSHQSAPSLWQRLVNFVKSKTGQSIKEARQEEEKQENEQFLKYFDSAQLQQQADETQQEDVENTASSTSRRNWFLNYFGIQTFSNFFKALKFEVWQVFSISWPMVINLLCYSIISMTDLSFVGHLGDEKLMAAAGVANAYTMCIAFIAFGMASGMDTLTSQAFGAKNFHMVSIVLLQAIIVCTATCIPLLLLVAFAKQFFLLIRLDGDVAQLAGEFSQLLGFSLWPSMMTRTLSRNLVNQRVVLTPMFIALFSVFLNVGLNYLCIYGVGPFQGFGFHGAPISTSICRWLQFFAMLLVSAKYSTGIWKLSDLKEALKPSGLWMYIKFAVPGMLQILFEVWGFEISSIISGYLDPASTSAHSIILQLSVVTFMIPLGISIAGTVRVGNMLGAGNAKAAKFSAAVSLVGCIGSMAINACFMVALKSVIGYIFTTNESIVSLVSGVIVIAASFQVFDGAQACANGLLRGMGRQHLGTVMNFIAYYIIGIPFGSFSAFYLGWRLYGIWAGLAIGLACVAVVLVLVVLIKTNWEEQAKAAIARMKSKEAPTTEEEEEASTELNEQEMNEVSKEEEEPDNPVDFDKESEITLWNVMENKECRDVFKQFARQEQSHDGIDFWEKVQRWKKSNSDNEKKLMKKHLVNAFIVESGERSLNFPHGVRLQLVAELNKPNATAAEDEQWLDKAVTHVVTDLLDVFVRFKTSDIWTYFAKSKRTQKNLEDAHL